jgi:MFS family permease
MLGLVWGLIRANAAGWLSPGVLGSLAAGALFCAAFVRWEQRASEPMLPVHLFRSRAFAAGNGAMLLLTASLFSAVFMLAQYLQISLGYSPLAAGLRFLPWTGALFVVAPLAGALAGRLGARPLLVTGLTLQGTGLAWVAYNIGQGNPYADSVVALVIAGCGTSMAIPSGQNLVMNSVPPAYLGKASGTFNSARQLGGVLGIAVLSAVFAANGSYSSARGFEDGAAPAMVVAAGLAFAGALAATLVAARRDPAAPAPAPVPERAGAGA